MEVAMAHAAARIPSRRRLATVVLAVAVALSAVGCELADPAGEGTLRYRDDVFAEVTRTNGITYGQATGYNGQPQVLALDLYRPTGDTNTSRPAVVWVHGGSFRSGNRSSAELVDQATYLGKKGYVGASITYRLTPNGCTTISSECLTAMSYAAEDARAAVRFLRANAATYGIDPTRIAIAGTSAGAITALNLAFGVGGEGTSGTPGVSSEIRSAVSLSGAVYFPGLIEPVDKPTLLFHGTADNLVTYQQAKTTYEQARADGLVSWLITYQDAGHVPYAQQRDDILRRTRNFLYHTLDLAHAA
jgi:acetyl esterase/lipase